MTVRFTAVPKLPHTSRTQPPYIKAEEVDHSDREIPPSALTLYQSAAQAKRVATVKLIAN